MGRTIQYYRNRDIVLERDNYTCQVCREPLDMSNPYKVRTHHLSYENDEPENLIALCASCHRREHRGGGPGSRGGIRWQDRRGLSVHKDRHAEIAKLILELSYERGIALNADDIIKEAIECFKRERNN